MFCLPIDIIIIGIAVMQYRYSSSKVKYMHIKLLALDIDGTLVTTEKIYRQAIRQLYGDL